MISISHYLYRKSGNWAIAAVAILLLPAMATAQLRDRTEHPRADQDQSQNQSKKPAKRGPRAIAVVEFLPKGGARLVPIALWMDGRYYDASFYGANPAPMALQPETLYQAMSYGEPTGWFTVTAPKQVNGNWVADGKWNPQTGSLDAKVAAQNAKQAKKKSSSISDDTGPPVLRRSPSSSASEPSNKSDSSADSSSGSPASSNSSSTSNTDSDRPTLKNSSPPDMAASSSDRPTLKNSSPPDTSASSSSRPTLGSDTSQAPAQPTASSNDSDPNRPVLHRGKPAAQPSSSPDETPPVSAGKASPPSAVPAKGTSAPRAPEAGRSYPAISDAGNYEMRSLLYSLTPAEKEERTRPMLALALDEVRTYNSKRQQAMATPKKPPAKTAARPENFTVSDYDLRAFDLDFSNSPTLVLTAKVPAPAQPPAGGEFDYFVTVVARVDINGQAQKIFSSVTDNNHLDAFPRLEIIDALDADANGRGDLLFRQHSDTGVSYALYRVYPYQMVKIFEGGSSI